MDIKYSFVSLKKSINYVHKSTQILLHCLFSVFSTLEPSCLAATLKILKKDFNRLLMQRICVLYIPQALTTLHTNPPLYLSFFA